MSRKQHYYTERGAPAETLDPKSFAEAEPNLRPGLAGALFVKDDAVVYPPYAARFLVREAYQLGTELIVGRRVVSFNGNTAKLDDRTSITYQNVALANGIAASSLARAINLQPRKGHLAITDRYPGFARHQIIELGYLKSPHAIQADSVAFNVEPRLSGQVLIGSSRQYGVNEPDVDSNVVSAMLQTGLRIHAGSPQAFGYQKLDRVSRHHS